MRPAEWIVALLQTILGVALLVGSFTLSPGKGGDPGPGLFPLLLGGLTLATAAGLFAHASQVRPDEPPEVDGRWRLALSGVVLSGVYLASVPMLGYFLATPMMIPAMVWYLGVRSTRWAVGSALGFALFGWLVFDYLFMVPLPMGLLGRLLG